MFDRNMKEFFIVFLDFIIHNVWIVFLWFFSLGLLVVPPMLKRASGYSDVNNLQATKIINDDNSLILDVRSQNEFASGKISRAKNIQVDQLLNKLATISDYKNKPVLVYCQSGMRSNMACRILRKSGFEQVFNLKGGVNAWVNGDLPLENDKKSKK